MLGIAIYHGLDLREHPGLVPLLIAGVREIAGEERLAYAGGTLSESGRSSRELRISARNLQTLEEELGEGRYESLEFNQYKRADRERNVTGVTLDLRISADPQASEEALCPYVVYVLIPEDAVLDTPALVAGAHSLARILESPYAFVYVGTSFNDVFMELTATPVFPWDHLFTLEEERRRDRLIQNQVERTRVGVQARGAYWGNFLGPRIVASLGGLERVVAEASVATVQPYGAAGVYLQVTDDPEQWHHPEYAERRSAFAKFLGSACIAGAAA